MVGIIYPPLVPSVPPPFHQPYDGVATEYRLMIGLKHQCFITRNAHFSVANTCETNARRRYLHRSAYIKVCLIFEFEMAKFFPDQLAKKNMCETKIRQSMIAANARFNCHSWTQLSEFFFLQTPTISNRLTGSLNLIAVGRLHLGHGRIPQKHHHCWR